MSELFSAFGIDWRLLIAQAVNFAIVLAALTYFLYRPVMATLDKRRAIVAKGVEDAAKAEEKLAGADAEAAKRVEASESEAAAIVARAHEAATEEKALLLKEAEARVVAIAADAQARAEESQARAKRDSEREVARLAVLAAEKVLREHHG